MKKIKLNLQHLENAEVLTRSQLKNVLGGSLTPFTATNCGVSCAGDLGNSCDNPDCSKCISKDGGPYVCVSN